MKIINIKTLIVLLWILLTAINIDKAYHIDDTFHLEAANCIKQNPLKPMSGLINWGNSPTPMYYHNQPPLFFYLLYFTQNLFGESEITMHLLVSVFTFLSLLFFYKLSVFLEVKHKKTLLTVFALCPAFIVNQNVMTDVPILAISLGTMYYLLRGLKSKNTKDYIVSALLLSAGLLIKYSLLPLFLVLLFSIILSKNYSKVFPLLIPVLALILWSIWNTFEFNSVHFLDRPKSGIELKKIVAFWGTLGSMAFFSIIYIHFYLPVKATRFLIWSLVFLFVLSVPLVYFGAIDELLFNEILNLFFIGNGLVLTVLILVSILIPLLKQKAEYFKTTDFPVALYIVGFSAFTALFAPFNATRHVLLIIPFFILFAHKKFEKSKTINTLVVTLTLVLGTLLGISDWVYADFYRKNARKVELTADNKVWSIGHWGWQWYSRKEGMEIYAHTNELNIQKGDFIVFPKDISKQELSADIWVDTIAFLTEPPDFFTFFSGKNFASMYNSFALKPAWSLSNAPIDTVFICRVKKEIEVNDIINKRIKPDANWLNHIKEKAVERNISLDSMLILDALWMINQQKGER